MQSSEWQGEPQAHADSEDGAALRSAKRRKRTTYPERCGTGPQRLLVLGAEVGGRWNSAARSFQRTLMRPRSLRAPAAVRRSIASGWARRWWGLLAVAVQQEAVGTTAWPSLAYNRDWGRQGPADGASPRPGPLRASPPTPAAGRVASSLVPTRLAHAGAKEPWFFFFVVPMLGLQRAPQFGDAELL